MDVGVNGDCRRLDVAKWRIPVKYLGASFSPKFLPEVDYYSLPRLPASIFRSHPPASHLMNKSYSCTDITEALVNFRYL
jgi:hypothetical protein